ncbi:13351_t:CDS:2 [Rhizophagus irregularis]|nr:13351_t:CDS:2 [Rhizophagus irregularis]
MLPETVNCNIRYSSYWERPYTQWKVSSWDDFYLEKYPNASKRKSHDSLGSELDALIKNLKPKTKHHNKVLLLKRNLEGRRAFRHRASATCIICYVVIKNVEILTSIEGLPIPDEKLALTNLYSLYSKKGGDTLVSYSVRRKIGAPDNVKAKDIELWRVNVPFEEFKENSILLNNIEVKEKLFPTVKISSVFDDEIPELKIHFIVKVPANIEGYILSELDLMTLSPNVKSYSTKDENVKEICKMPCPSTSASPECSGPPVSLYHPVFSQFLLNYRNNELEISLKHYTEVLNLCNVAGQIYQNESDRQHALRPFFTSLFDGIQPISIVTDNGSIDDDVLLIDNTVFEEKAVPILWEYKNEIGTEGKDPSIQGRCGYAKYWAQSQIKSNKY